MRNKRHIQNRQLQGLTLLELLVALVLLGILAALVNGVLAVASDSIQTARSGTHRAARIEALDRLLGAALKSMKPARLSVQERMMAYAEVEKEEGVGTLRFLGAQFALGFCLDRPFAGAGSDGYFHWIELRFEENEEERYDLILHDTAFLRGVDEPIQEEELLEEETLSIRTYTLLEDLQYGEFLFHDQMKETPGSDPEWEDRDPLDVPFVASLPGRIQLRLLDRGARETILSFRLCEILRRAF